MVKEGENNYYNFRLADAYKKRYQEDKRKREKQDEKRASEIKNVEEHNKSILPPSPSIIFDGTRCGFTVAVLEDIDWD